MLSTYQSAYKLDHILHFGSKAKEQVLFHEQLEPDQTIYSNACYQLFVHLIPPNDSLATKHSVSFGSRLGGRDEESSFSE